MSTIRYSMDAMICLVEAEDGTCHVASQEDMETLEIGEDLTDDELDTFENA